MNVRYGWALCVVALVACATTPSGGSTAATGSNAVTVPTTAGPGPTIELPGLPASLLSGYVKHPATLDVTAISLDAIDAPALRSVLETAGFRAGSEQRYTARGKALTEVVARVLRFGSPDGAGAYLEWVRTHGADLLGSLARPAGAPSSTGAVAFSHVPCGSCTKDTFQYYAAWARGSYVLTVLVGGPHAGRASAEPIAAALDTAVKEGK